jgi:hypothetical protein
LDHHPLTESQWEVAWAPYDEATYTAALEFLGPDDAVLDIGAGDLRFARRAAERARTVIAIEQRPGLLNPPYPSNLTVISGDALAVPFPEGVSVGVLLMRHCRHFSEYVFKLRAVGAKRLITNARWRVGVERIDFNQPRASFENLDAGWWACLCGATGFAARSPDEVNAEVIERVNHLATCPNCRASSQAAPRIPPPLRGENSCPPGHPALILLRR